MQKRVHYLAAALVAVILASTLGNEDVRLALVAAILGSDITTLTNEERGVRDLQPLTENPLLTQAAQAKAEDMASKGYFDHNTPDGKSFTYFIKQTGYSYTYAGENLAVKFDSAEDVTEAWMNSKSHRANILDGDFTEVGVGVAEGIYKGRKAIFVAQAFGKPKGFSILPAAARESKILGQKSLSTDDSEEKSIVAREVPSFIGLFDLSKGQNLHGAADERRVRVFPRILDFVLYFGT